MLTQQAAVPAVDGNTAANILRFQFVHLFISISFSPPTYSWYH